MAESPDQLEEKIKSRRNRSKRRRSENRIAHLDYSLIAEAESYASGLSGESHDLQRNITAYRLSHSEFLEEPTPEIERFLRESEQRLRLFVLQRRRIPLEIELSDY